MFRTTNPIQTPRKTFRPRWKEIGATAVVMALVATGTYTALDIAAGSPQPAVEATTPACPTEDSNCFWNAQTQGNGFGESFYVDEAGQVYYLPATECQDNLKAWTRDATQMIEDMDSRWASSAAYSASVRTDNIDPMTSRLDYVLTTLCD